MTSQSKLPALSPNELAQFGLARARDKAFNAVYTLWKRRQREGLLQKQVAEAINRDPSRVSKELSGPGNWTMKTLGGLVEALGGELEITVYAKEDQASDRTNYDAYSGYGARPEEFCLEAADSTKSSASKSTSIEIVTANWAA